MREHRNNIPNIYSQIMFQSRLNSETLAYLKLLEKHSLCTDLHTYTPELARQERQNINHDISVDVPFLDQIKDITVPSTHVPDGIPVTVYKPDSLPSTPVVLAYFHGGGMVIGNRSNVDSTCRLLSLRSPCIVVNVEYRLAPEHKFPASFEDAESVVRWILQNKTELGGSPESKVGVAGDSAGATLSATVCHQVAGLAFQVLVYPRVNSKPGPIRPSLTEYGDGPILTKEYVAWYRSHFLKDSSDVNHILLNPYFRDGFENLPVALMIVAECDPLRDDSYDYQRKMRDVGVRSELLQIDGASHSFFTSPGVFKGSCAKAYGRVTEFIREFNKG